MSASLTEVNPAAETFKKATSLMCPRAFCWLFCMFLEAIRQQHQFSPYSPNLHIFGQLIHKKKFPRILVANFTFNLTPRSGPNFPKKCKGTGHLRAQTRAIQLQEQASASRASTNHKGNLTSKSQQFGLTPSAIN